MTFKTSIFRLLAVGSLTTATFAAQANFIDPLLLKTSIDGPGQDVQSFITNAGFTSSVGTTIPDYGDQTSDEIFNQCDPGTPMDWRIIWQHADFSGTHKLGYYTNIGDAVINPSDITWVLGDLDDDHDPNDLVSDTGSFNINNWFGLAFFESRPDGNDPHIYFSQVSRNPDPNPVARDHVATINALPLRDPWMCSTIATWEDSFNQTIDKDFNDMGILLDGAGTVPEPATLAALGFGAVALLRRRSKK